MNTSEKSDDNLQLKKILPLTLTGFLAIMTETMPVGMLKSISEALNISPSLAGQLVSLYAVGSFISAIPIIALTRSLNRKSLLLAALFGFFVTNLAVAFTSNYFIILVERFLSGMSAAICWGLLAGYAVRVSPISKHGKALSIMGIGQPVALAIGVPTTSWLVTFLPWQTMFVATSILALVVFIWVYMLLPGIPGDSKGDRKPILAIIFRREILSILAILFFWVSAHSLMYTYVSPYLEYNDLSQMLKLVLFTFGVLSIIGISLTSIFVDKHLNSISLLSAVLFAAAGLLFYLFPNNSTMVMTATVLWGLTFGGAPTLLVKYLSDSAGKDIDVAQSSFVTLFNLAIFTGSFVGGGLLRYSSANSLPVSMLVISMVSFAFLVMFLRHKKKH